MEKEVHPTKEPSIHKTALIDETATIDENVFIGPYVIIGKIQKFLRALISMLIAV